MERVLITGGAGFAGSSLALLFKGHYPKSKVICFDNLKRRGSELALSRLKAAQIHFQHGDVRIKQDLLDLTSETGGFDLIIDCAAEPSVLAGVNGSPAYVIDTNFTGTINCLELARLNKAALIFLSTSRVYPVKALNQLLYHENETRFELSADQSTIGASKLGISEQFPLQGARSLYGASKLASELFVQEYIDSYGLKAIINRCGVLSGPWQMGKIDQGVIVLWIAKHFFGGELSYIGYGGQGKQVRDILHIKDLFELLKIQLSNLNQINGEIFNVGGGYETSVSLRELTALSQKATQNQIKISSVLEDRPNDLPIYLTDCSKVKSRLGWSPKISSSQIVTEIADWIKEHQRDLRAILG